MPRQTSALATAGGFLGGVALVAGLLGPALAHLDAVAPLTGFQIFLLGGLLGLVALVLGALGLRRARPGAGRDRAWFGIAVGAVLLVLIGWGARPGLGLPRINDITTSPDDPPAFEYVHHDPATRARDWSYPAGFAAQQRAAYPDLAPIHLVAPPRQVFQAATDAASALGWNVTLADPRRGVLEARARTPLFHFVDDVAVRVRPDPAGGSVVDVRSKSRDGQGDLGANARRIRAFAAALRAKLSQGG